MNYLPLALALLIVLLAILAFLSFRRWVHEKKITEEQIQRLEEEKNAREQFLGVISHELKGTIASLIFLSSQLRGKHPEMASSQVNDALEMIMKTAKNTHDLLENLLQWSLMNTGRLEARPRVFELKNVLEANTRLFQQYATGKQVLINLEVPDRIKVFADENMTAFIIRNLLANALRAMDRPGEIRISCHDNGTETEIRVEDEGNGIQQADLENLLHPEKTFDPGKGDGLGLFLCREFAEKNGGWLKAQSEPERGSVFTFALKKP